MEVNEFVKRPPVNFAFSDERVRPMLLDHRKVSTQAVLEEAGKLINRNREEATARYLNMPVSILGSISSSSFTTPEEQIKLGSKNEEFLKILNNPKLSDVDINCFGTL